MPFVILCAQTILLWLIAIILHRKKEQITLIPLYVYIALLTVLTHNLSDLGLAIVMGKWFFLIASFSFFTTLMFATLFLYLFEGPRAGRFALWVILGSSFFYITLVALLGLQADTSQWVQFTPERAGYYFWSLTAILVDVFVLAVLWELLSRLKSLPLVARVFLVGFSVFAIDTIIFTSGAFASSGYYQSILTGNLMIRLALSLIGAPIIAYFLRLEGFEEAKRVKPKSLWEIVNFRSDLETKISLLEEEVGDYQALEKKLKQAEETYQLAIAGTGAGIWDWNVLTNEVIWSPRFCTLLGYAPGGIKGNLDAFKKILHPDELESTFALVERRFQEKKPFELEYRLKTKSGAYRWYYVTGVTKYDQAGKPIRMVGSIIDIDKRKQTEISLKKNVDELTKLNEVMVGRELKMIELKKQLMTHGEGKPPRP
ncbi:MAG: PAS domain-containing protein [Patescibacteria group bacterium]